SDDLSQYCVSGGVWTNDLVRAERCVRKMRMGTVWINEYNVYFPEAPWGGYKQSGFGSELGKTGLEEYQEQKHILTNLQPEAMNWLDRKSTRLNSSHVSISYAVFCLKKK